MYFYPKHISGQALQALQGVGLELKGGEMVVPDADCRTITDLEIILRGVRLVKHRMSFNGHADPPKVWSSLDGDMVYSGRDLNQCHICGVWLIRKPNPEDERQHDQQCHPQYRWLLA